MGTYAEEWWLRPGGGCEPIQLAQALHGAILTDLLPITTEKRKTIAGIVSTTDSAAEWKYDDAKRR